MTRQDFPKSGCGYNWLHLIISAGIFTQMDAEKNIIQSAETLFRQSGGILRASEALALGIHPRTLYQLRDSKRVIQISRGLYRLGELPDLLEPDLVTVAIRVRQAVTCLISALSFHEITTEIPHEVHIAL